MADIILYYSEGIGGRGSYREVWKGEAKNLGAIDAAEEIFERFNIGDHGGLRIRSMSVGDIVKVGEIFYHCNLTGWSEIDPEVVR